jgi:hypothetical protein
LEKGQKINMKMKTTIAELGILAAAVMATGQVGAQTTNVTMTLTSTIADSGFSATLNGTGIIGTSDLIGIYAFQVSSVSPANTLISSGGTLYGVCLSPPGNLGWSAENYTVQPFATPGNSAYTPAWVTPQGIQNANYLFSTYAPTLEAGKSIAGLTGPSANDQATALAMAMYTALYNSTGFGVAADGTASVGFDVALSGTFLADYNALLRDLSAYSGASQPIGYVLTPDAGQPDGEQTILFTPVPEASTIIAGALMVLPFGASALRILRKKRAA